MKMAGEVSPQLEGAPSGGADKVRPKWEQLEWEEKVSRVGVECFKGESRMRQ